MECHSCDEPPLCANKIVMFAATSAVALANCMDCEELDMFTDFLGLLKYNLEIIKREKRGRKTPAPCKK